MSIDEFNERKKQILQYLFEQGGGQPFYRIPVEKVERDLNLPPGDLRKTHVYGLLEHIYSPLGMQNISLKPSGIELATKSDTRPVTNIVHAAGAQNLAIMQGNSHSSQSVTFQQNALDTHELTARLSDLIKELESFNGAANQDEHLKAIANVKAMAELAASPEPEPKILSAIWDSVKRTLGTAALSYAVNQAPNIHVLTQQISRLLGV